MKNILAVHFMGIRGSGASAVAAIAKATRFEVSGCDSSFESEFTKELEEVGIQSKGSVEHLKGIDILAVSPAVTSLDPDNEELKEARKRGVEVVTWQEFMGKYLLKDKFVVAICGTHGKTTTTAMTAKILEDSNLDPTVVVGAIIPEWKRNFRVGKSKYFVVEADEFNDNFLAIWPDIAVVTAVEMDHPEYFSDFESYKKSFVKFLGRTKKVILANLSNMGVAEVIKKVMKQSGVSVIDYTRSEITSLSLKILGEHNLQNAKAAFQVGLALGIDPNFIRTSLNSFSGVSRRLEYLGKYKNAEIYSDFGHHPTKIKVTIKALREKFPNRRIVLIYEPHMFSRTKALFADFVEVIRDIEVDQVFILDIYPSREKDTGLVSSKELVEAISKNTVSYLGPKEEVENFLKLVFRKDDIVLFMGAGDIDKLARKIMSNGDSEQAS